MLLKVIATFTSATLGWFDVENTEDFFVHVLINFKRVIVESSHEHKGGKAM